MRRLAPKSSRIRHVRPQRAPIMVIISSCQHGQQDQELKQSAPCVPTTAAHDGHVGAQDARIPSHRTRLGRSDGGLQDAQPLQNRQWKDFGIERGVGVWLVVGQSEHSTSSPPSPHLVQPSCLSRYSWAQPLNRLENLSFIVLVQIRGAASASCCPANRWSY